MVVHQAYGLLRVCAMDMAYRITVLGVLKQVQDNRFRQLWSLALHTFVGKSACHLKLLYTSSAVVRTDATAFSVLTLFKRMRPSTVVRGTETVTPLTPAAVIVSAASAAFFSAASSVEAVARA